MRKTVFVGALILVLIVFAAVNGLSRQTEKAAPSGPYLGQNPPGSTPEVFAPGIVSKEGDQGRLFIAADGASPADEKAVIEKASANTSARR